MAKIITVEDHEIRKFTTDSRVRVTQDAGDSWSVVVSSVATPEVVNISVPGTANTEFSYDIPEATKKFTIRTRSRSQLQITYTSGGSGTEYFTIRPGFIYEEKNLSLDSDLTIFMQSNKIGDTVELLLWS